MSEPLTSRVPAEQDETARDGELLYRLEEYWDESVPWEERIREAREALQGAWFTASGRREADLFVCGSRFTIHFRDGELYMGVFDVNPAAEPWIMDMHIEEGPARHKGQTALCICEVNGRTLRWCTGDPRRSERLRKFPESNDPNTLCLLFRRDRSV